MLDRPLATILSVGPHNITCSAYGNPSEMTGTVTSPENKLMTFEVIREENLFLMKATMTQSGTYICTIKSKANQVQSFTILKILSCELFVHFL